MNSVFTYHLPFVLHAWRRHLFLVVLVDHLNLLEETRQILISIKRYVYQSLDNKITPLECFNEFETWRLYDIFIHLKVNEV